MLSEIDKKKAMTIVRIFETGKITGDYSAVAVLDDGAGISYGISQFTHRSGSLATVVQKYLSTEANVGRVVLEEKLPLLKRKTPAAIRTASADTKLKAALKAAAITSEMRQTQDETAEQLYLQPAMDICASMGFTQPLSLAVIYDSLNHGSWERIRDQVPFSVTSNGANLTQERLWITTYVRKRDAWLASVKRLAVTRYRTQFFLGQIAVSNWELKLPVRVHGVLLTCADLMNSTVGPAAPPKNGPPDNRGGSESTSTPSSSNSADDPPPTQAQPLDHCLGKVESAVNAASEKFDRVEGVIENVVVRADAAKSLWTMIVGSLWQTMWGMIGFFAGVPKEVWLVVAVSVGVLCAIYLYRQIVLGRIRELRSNGSFAEARP